MFNNKTILITGGTGSFGQVFTRYLLKHHPEIRRIVIFSRDEQKQHEMARKINPAKYPVRYLLGDVRDLRRVHEAMREVNIVVHAAAVKHVPIAEANPMEVVKTNILGAQNVIDAALDAEVEKVVALSTDKAVHPINTYGASKLLLEKLFLFADLENSDGKTRFCVVRYGNIFGSKGSVVPFFLKEKAKGILPVTSPDMTRFSITLQESIDLVLFALTHGWGGEVVVPVAPSYRVVDVARAVCPECRQEIIGKRKGEKLEEILISVDESYDSVERDGYRIICPVQGRWDREEYLRSTDAVPLKEGEAYRSGANDRWLDMEAIRRLIREQTIL